MNRLLSASLLLASSLYGQGNASAVLSRMDAAAPGFRGLTARISRITYTAVIKDSSEEQGQISLLRVKGKDIRVLTEITRPDHKFFTIGDGKVEIYTPKIATVQEIDLTRHKSLMEQFLLLGFGASGKDLVKSYSVRMAGSETIAGVKASHLELIPKSAQVKSHYNRIDLWIADPGGYPVRQKLNEPSGNYLMVTYSDIRLNPDLKPAELRLKLPAGVKREYPQK